MKTELKRMQFDLLKIFSELGELEFFSVSKPVT